MLYIALGQADKLHGQCVSLSLPQLKYLIDAYGVYYLTYLNNRYLRVLLHTMKYVLLLHFYSALCCWLIDQKFNLKKIL